MPEINNQQFFDQNTLVRLRNKADEFLRHEQLWELKLLADTIEQKLKENPHLATNNPSLYNEFQQMILWLKLVSFSIHDDQTCLFLIKNHFVDTLRFDLNLNQLMNTKMYSIPSLAWPDFAAECVEALKLNTQRIGGGPLEVEGHNTPVSSTIKNWLIDYARRFGPDKHTELERAQYLTQNPNTNKLSDREKKGLSVLLRFYDNLKPIPASQLEETASQTPSVSQPPQSNKPNAPLATPSVPKQSFSYNQQKSDTPASNPTPVIPQEEQPQRPQSPPQPQPKIEGNIVDLKNLPDNQNSE